MGIKKKTIHAEYLIVSSGIGETFLCAGKDFRYDIKLHFDGLSCFRLKIHGTHGFV